MGRAGVSEHARGARATTSGATSRACGFRSSPRGGRDRRRGRPRDEEPTQPAEIQEAQLLAARGETSAALAAVETLLAREPADVQRAAAQGPPAAGGARGGARARGVPARGRRSHRLGRGAGRAGALPARDGPQRRGAVGRASRPARQLARPENFAQTAPVYLTLVWMLPRAAALPRGARDGRGRPRALPRRGARPVGLGRGGGAGAKRSRSAAESALAGFPFSFPVEVRFRDLDAIGHVNNAEVPDVCRVRAHRLLAAAHRPQGPRGDGHDPGPGRDRLPLAGRVRRAAGRRRAVVVDAALVVRDGIPGRRAGDAGAWWPRARRCSSTTTTRRRAPRRSRTRCGSGCFCRTRRRASSRPASGHPEVEGFR